MSEKMSRKEFRELAGFTSYLPYVKPLPEYYPDFFEKIAYPAGEKTLINTKYANFSCDTVEKIGLMFLASELINTLDNAAHALCPIPYGSPKQRQLSSYLAQIKYHTYMFIWSTRSLIDAFSVHLNDFWSLGFKNSDIWLGKRKFLEKLKQKRNSIYTELIELENWLLEVDKYRLVSIHREPLTVIPNLYETATEESFSEKWEICIPKRIEAEGNFIRLIFGAELDLVPLLPILKQWLNNAEKISEIIYKDTLETLTPVKSTIRA